MDGKRALDFDYVETLAGDLSGRKYFRVRYLDNFTAVVAKFPENMETVMEKFLLISNLLLSNGVKVPLIYKVDPISRIVIMEDLGRANIFDAGIDVGKIITNLLDIIKVIQAIPVEKVSCLNPPLDFNLMNKELDEAVYYLSPFSYKDFFPRVAEYIKQNLYDIFGKVQLVTTHRDYMVRNIIVKDRNIYILDYQDMRESIFCYDIASLLNDSFFASKELEDFCLSYMGYDREMEFCYRIVSLQRILKAASTFVKFARRGVINLLRMLPELFYRLEYQLQLLKFSIKVDWDRGLLNLASKGELRWEV